METILFTGDDAAWYKGQIYEAIFRLFSRQSPTESAKLYDMLKKEALKK